MIRQSDTKVKVVRIISGKFRRYNHLTWLQQLLWFKLVLLNLRDIILIAVGFIQSLALLIIWRPDVIFLKGGYVCLPVGYAARLLFIPIVIHDSDAHPGLANRLLSRIAYKIATGAPLKYYSYPVAKSKYVGIPISAEFNRVSPDNKLAFKRQWGIESSRPLIVVTGGGLGASRINMAVAECIDELLIKFNVILVSGSFQYDELRALMPPNSNRFQLYPFVSSGMASLLSAADIVVTRAGATTLLELAALAKPVIIIPNARLVGAHQLKNANVYEEAGAAVVLDETKLETDSRILYKEIMKLSSDNKKMQTLSDKIHAMAKLNAAKDVAKMILTAVKRES